MNDNIISFIEEFHYRFHAKSIMKLLLLIPRKMRCTTGTSPRLYATISSSVNCTDLGKNTLITPPPSGSRKTHETAGPNFVSTAFMDWTGYSTSFLKSPMERFRMLVCCFKFFRNAIVTENRKNKY